MLVYRAHLGLFLFRITRCKSRVKRAAFHFRWSDSNSSVALVSPRNSRRLRHDISSTVPVTRPTYLSLYPDTENASNEFVNHSPFCSFPAQPPLPSLFDTDPRRFRQWSHNYARGWLSRSDSQVPPTLEITSAIELSNYVIEQHRDSYDVTIKQAVEYFVSLYTRKFSLYCVRLDRYLSRKSLLMTNRTGRRAFVRKELLKCWTKRGMSNDFSLIWASVWSKIFVKYCY